MKVSQKEGRGASPVVGEQAEVEEGHNKRSQTIQQNQVAFRTYWKFQIFSGMTLRVSNG